jgi:hypothetical protein
MACPIAPPTPNLLTQSLCGTIGWAVWQSSAANPCRDKACLVSTQHTLIAAYGAYAVHPSRRCHHPNQKPNLLKKQTGEKQNSENEVSHVSDLLFTFFFLLFT